MNKKGSFNRSYENKNCRKKFSFPLRISSVNVTNSAVSCRFGHICWRNRNGKLHFLCNQNLELCWNTLFFLDVNVLETVPRSWSVKYLHWKSLINSLENNYAGVPFLIRLQAAGSRLATLWKKRLLHKCFPANVTFFRTTFSVKHLFMAALIPRFSTTWIKRKDINYFLSS